MNRLNAIFPHEPCPAKVRVVSGALIARFRASQPPVIWRMDLDKHHSFTVAVQPGGSGFDLGIVSPKGEFAPIARFADQAAADAAQAAVTCALFHNPKGGRALLRRIAPAALFIAALALGSLWAADAAGLWPQPQMIQAATPLQPSSAVVPRAASVVPRLLPEGRTTPASVPVPLSAPAAPQNGVPMDADALLGK